MVPSGVVIRATGTVTIAGTLVVEPKARAGSFWYSTSPVLQPRLQMPEPGVAGTIPPTPTVVEGPATAYEGGGAVGLGQAARFILRPGPTGGGGGWYGYFPAGHVAMGGGSLVIAAARIVVEGTIDAQGGGTQSWSCRACSGGGGGFVVLAARESLTTHPRALINARGGDGGDSVVTTASGVTAAVGHGAGGGGGGGCVHFIAPSIVHEGQVNIDPGEPGRNTTHENPPSLKIGGYGGGASCGSGGSGGRFNTNSASLAARPGTSGQYFRTEADPTSLL